MKKLIVLAILLLTSVSFAATASWDVTNPEAVPIEGFTLRWHDTANPGTVWNMTAPSGTAREMNLLDAWFLPGHEYQFTVEAYNTTGKSELSETANYTCSQTPYEVPSDSIPPETSLPSIPPAPEGMKLESAQWVFTYVPGP